MTNNQRLKMFVTPPEPFGMYTLKNMRKTIESSNFNVPSLESRV